MWMIPLPARWLQWYRPTASGSKCSNTLQTRCSGVSWKLCGIARWYFPCGDNIYPHRLKEIVRGGCFAHGRRYFFEAISKKTTGGYEYCNHLFQLERECKDLSGKEKKAACEKYERPILDEFFDWVVLTFRSTKLGKSADNRVFSHFLDVHNH